VAVRARRAARGPALAAALVRRVTHEVQLPRRQAHAAGDHALGRDQRALRQEEHLRMRS